MPQIQTLPYQQTPLEQLMPHVEQAVGDLSTGFGKYLSNKKDVSILEQIKSAQTPMEQMSLIMQLSPQKQAVAAPLITAYSRGQTKGQPTAKDLMTIEKEKGKYQGQMGAIDYLRERIPYTGSTAVPGPSFLARGNVGAIVHPSGVAKRAEFQSAVAPLMSFLKDLDTRGNLPQGLFNKLMERLPDVELTEAENKGRINAIEDAIKRYAPDYVKESPKQSTNKGAAERPPLESFIR